jgi:hypothetical protein
MNKTKICILGAGIGGLTTAHELAKHPQYEIHVYERNDKVGGQSRSVTLPGGDVSLYCWHVIGNGYINLISILKEIRSYDGRTVLNHLKPIEQYIYGRSTKEEGNKYKREFITPFITKRNFKEFIEGIKSVGSDITYKDIYYISRAYIIANIASEKRLEKYDSIKWKTYMKELSPEAQKWIIDSTSIYIGMDYDKLSAHTILNLLQKNICSRQIDSRYTFFSFDGPISDVWFDPWVDYLNYRGVQFHFGESIEKIRCNDEENKIVSIKTSREDEVKSDIFVNSLPIESFAQTLQNNSSVKNRYQQLSWYSQQIQTQVTYYFNQEINISKPVILIFPDTTWCLMIRAEGPLWNNNILSVGIGIWDRPGIMYNKAAIRCTREEIAQECWEQLKTADGLMKSLKLADGTSLLYLDTPRWNIWDSFDYDCKEDLFLTSEPKFSNNCYTLKLRPHTVDEKYNNLRHATAYTRTETNIFNMESAAEAGIKAVESITLKKAYNSRPRSKRGRFLRLLRYLDKYICH